MMARGLGRIAPLGFALAAFVVIGTNAAKASRAPDAPVQSVTFSKDIAPILFDRCAKCHRSDGAAPFSLLTYAAVRQRASLVASVTKARTMPPWKGEPGYGEFVEQQRLTDAEVERIQRWAEDGAPEGNPQDLPAAPKWTEGWQLGKPDLIVTLPQPYTLRADGTDDFRAFFIPIPIKTARFVRGLEFRPTNRVVHHADFAIGRTPSSRERLLDPTRGEDGRPDRIIEEPPGQILGWTAGQGDTLLPKGLAWRLEPGTDLVIQLHMQPSGKPETVQASIGFYFTDDAPAETPSLLRLGSQRIDIPAGEAHYTISDSYTLPVDVEVRSVRPHAHWRAREMKGFATLPDGTTKWLIYIKDWDFRWQNMYRYVTPFTLPKGTVLTMQYSYDNSAANARNPLSPPQRARWGPQTRDEMGDLWIQVLARDAHDVAALSRDFKRKAAEETVVGYETLIETDPDNLGLQNDAAFGYLELGRPKEASAHFEAFVRRKPESAAAHFNLGVALRLAGRVDDAIREHETALRLKPDFAAAHYGLGQLLDGQDRLEDALPHYLEAIRLDPANSGAHNNAGFALARMGELDEAMSQYQDALRIDPRSSDAHYNTGVVRQLRGEWAGAIAEFRSALTFRPEWPPVMADLAWALAVAPDDRVRDPDQAVQLAERAIAVSRRRDAEALDVLAAAYAAAGQFDRALDIMREALTLNPPNASLSDMLQRQALYRTHQSYRMSSAR